MALRISTGFRIAGRFNHKKAYEEAREGLLKSMEAVLKRDMNAHAEWVVIPSMLD